MLEGELAGFGSRLDLLEVQPGLRVLTLTLDAPEPAVPPACTIRWAVPATGMHGYWSSRSRIDRVNPYDADVTARVASQAPVLCFYDHGDGNRMTIACSDALNQARLRFEIVEETAVLAGSVRLFEQPVPARSSFRVQLRIDTRPVPFYQALSEVADWWADQEGYAPMPVPAAARVPLYSTWYGFHQNLTTDEVLAECRVARELGCGAVIIDDGWQTVDSQRGYAYTGDWRPERMSDLRGLVDQVHALDMKFLLWYSLPFVGVRSDAYARFADKTLFDWESEGAAILDPRYPEVREYLIGIFETALDAWDLDGFKIDFVDEFRARQPTGPTANKGRDHVSVDHAVDRLMSDLVGRLRAKKPDLLIEFRQTYIGPLMRTYGNMFRAADCPYGGGTNRNRTIDLRLLSGNTAVHSDMLMWHPQDTVEHAALQILNVLFSVPQLSVRFDRIPPDHLAMIRFWMNYWVENCSVLLDGALVPVQPAMAYPQVRARGTEKEIVALYADMPVHVSGGAADIINAKATATVVVRGPVEGPGYSAIAFDTTGRKVSTTHLEPGPHPNALSIPASGLLQLVPVGGGRGLKT